MPFVRSFVYALQGIAHALQTERNLKVFTVGYIVSLALGVFLQLDLTQWPLLVFAGGMFLAVELVNTALEHLSDAFHSHSSGQDDHHTDAIRATKDIAAGAALVCAVVWVGVLILIFLPHVRSLLS